MIAVGAAIAVWTTVMLYMDKRIHKNQLHVIDACEDASAAGSEAAPGKPANVVETKV